MDEIGFTALNGSDREAKAMNTEFADWTALLTARYAEAVQYEKDAWHALPHQSPGSGERVEAWAHWIDAIARTNGAWRELKSRSLMRPVGSKTLLPNMADRFAGRH
jgi:hypothetical protein